MTARVPLARIVATEPATQANRVRYVLDCGHSIIRAPNHRLANKRAVCPVCNPG